MSSPFAPQTFPALPAIAGLVVGVGACGLRYLGRDDLFAVRLTTDNPTIAAVFTKNAVVGEPVKWSRTRLPNTPELLVVAAGNANVFTGKAGTEVLQQVADQQDANPDRVYFAMTGVIGEPFPATPILGGLDRLNYTEPDAEIWQRAAQSITTTDTFAKGSTCTAVIDGKTVQIIGIAKGSGMIAPDMATMLSFLFTDATIPQPALQAMLTQAVEDSFNNISVDSDTSTSDTVKLIATGSIANATAVNPNAALYNDFRAALQTVCDDLAGQVIRDGEGITKLLNITVGGAKSVADAKTIAMSIANSPLVKTAASGADANWGRIAMAVGKADIALDPDRLSISFGAHQLAANGVAIPFDVAAVDEIMRQSTIRIHVHLGCGDASATVLGNDLSYEYIRINADYRS